MGIFGISIIISRIIGFQLYYIKDINWLPVVLQLSVEPVFYYACNVLLRWFTGFSPTSVIDLRMMDVLRRGPCELVLQCLRCLILGIPWRYVRTAIHNVLLPFLVFFIRSIYHNPQTRLHIHTRTHAAISVEFIYLYLRAVEEYCIYF